ncbi:MAG: DUF2442 domain-containing protein [Cyanobacteria bacterium REEB446]|nr:DUF2442 domain-containing protein [Cyanobacteria bacterium REEB446]
MSKPFHKIQSCIALEAYKLLLSFEDGVTGEIDLSEKVGKGVFQALENIENFKQVKISSDKRSLQWLNGIDLCADSLYLKIKHSIA